jgi:hypothetical protein
MLKFYANNLLRTIILKFNGYYSSVSYDFIFYIFYLVKEQTCIHLIVKD